MKKKILVVSALYMKIDLKIDMKIDLKIYNNLLK